jgi:hypothetical protein
LLKPRRTSASSNVFLILSIYIHEISLIIHAEKAYVINIAYIYAYNKVLHICKIFANMTLGWNN